MKEFKDMQLKPELTESLKRIGFVTTTEVQEAAIPVILSGKDAIVRAKTGTGKTGAFLVPILEKIPHNAGVQAIIIVPTRELALQVSSVAEKLGSYMHFDVATVYGGASMNVQISMLKRGASIVVGTPGRIIDLVDRGVLKLNNIKFLVLDEGDTMLDMGFIEDIEYVMSKSPAEKQTLLFSATMPRPIVDIARRHMNSDYKTITVGKEEELTVTSITHTYFFAKGRMKYATLLAYIKQYNPQKAIIFSRTKHEANVIHMVLVKQGFDAILLHGGLTQARREKSLSNFRSGAKFLIATNVAARGLDIDNVTDVINFDAPENPHDYVHRVGRSARMGKEGRAFTIVGLDEKGLIRAIQYEANVQMQQINLDINQFLDIEVLKHLNEGRMHSRQGGGTIERRPHGGGGFRGREGGRGGGREHGPSRFGGDRQGGDRHGGFRPRRRFSRGGGGGYSSNRSSSL
ncbi:MAG: DEAD/DEAH box helicase [Candidatus Micrarchaeales archaeon]